MVVHKMLGGRGRAPFPANYCERISDSDNYFDLKCVLKGE
jgi:hypothetical protein